MLVWDVRVTTACAWANVNRTPAAASRSRLGVIARPPYDPSASARSVSIEIKSTLRSARGAMASPLVRVNHQPAAMSKMASTTRGTDLFSTDLADLGTALAFDRLAVI